MSVTPQQQLDAFKAAADATLQAPVVGAVIPTDRRAYDYDNVPEPRPVSYVSLQLSRRYIEGFRMGGPHGLRAGRLFTGYVSQHIDNARELQRLIRLAFEDVPLLSGALGPLRFELEEPIAGTDDGYFYGYDSWTFANPA